LINIFPLFRFDFKEKYLKKKKKLERKEKEKKKNNLEQGKGVETIIRHTTCIIQNTNACTNES